MAVLDPMRITGLDDLQRALVGMDESMQRRLNEALREIGQKVQKDAKAKIPRRSGRAAGSVVFEVKNRKVFVTGGKNVPYYGWLDFGGTTGRGHKKGPYKGSVKRQRRKEGRFIYPALGSAAPFIFDALNAVLVDAAHDVGLEARVVQ